MQSFQEALKVHVAALAAAHSQEVIRLQAEIRRLTEELAGCRSSVLSDALEVSKERSGTNILPRGHSCESLGSQSLTEASEVRELEDSTNIHQPHAGSNPESNRYPPPCTLSRPEESKETSGPKLAIHSVPDASVNDTQRRQRHSNRCASSSRRGSTSSCRSFKIQKPSSRRLSTRRMSSMSTLSSNTSFGLPGSWPERLESECLSSHSSFDRFCPDPQEEASDSDTSQATSVMVSFKLLDVWSHSLRSGAASRTGRRAATVHIASSLQGIISRSTGTESSDEIHSQVQWKSFEVNEKMKVLMSEPSSITNILWQASGLGFLIKDVITVPLEVFNISSSRSLLILTWLSCGFWTLDIFHSFFTGYIREQGVVETRFLKVARRYAKSWLLLDAMCTTCDWVMLISFVSTRGTGSVNDFLKPASVLRMFRFMRLVKAPEIEASLEEHFHSEMTKVAVGIAKAVALLLGIAHIIACAWYSIGGHAYESWIMHHKLGNLTVFERYALSLHWSLAQFVGESLFEVRSVSEHGFAMCILMFAFVFSALFISSITTAMTRIQVLASNEAAQNRELHYYLADNAISTSLAMRVTRNAQHAVAEHKKQAPESSITLLQLVSEPLRAELHFEMRAPVLAVHPFFECYQEVNAVGVREVCHLAVSPLPVSTGDIIFSELETPVCPRMFFMTGDGSLQYFRELTSQEGGQLPTRSSECEVGKVQRGGWAGEPVLWTNWMHRGSLRAESNCILLAVDAVRFQRIISPFPSQHAAMYGGALLETLNAAPHQELTDLKIKDQYAWVTSAFPSHPKYSTKADLFGKRWSFTSVGSQGTSRSSSRSSRRFSFDDVRQM